MILLTHPTGNANVRQAATALCEAGLLAEFWTCFAPNASKATRWMRRLPGGREFSRRNVPELLIPYTRQRPTRELLRLGATRLGKAHLVSQEGSYASIDTVYQDLDKHVARLVSRHPASFSGVYAYEDGAVESFRAAKTAGLKTIYDLPIGYWRAGQAIYRDEAERHPEWAGTLTGARDSAAKLARKDEELALAEAVIVATSFTRKTLELAPTFGAKIHVIPYGAPIALDSGSDLRPRQSGPLRLLFAGSLTQRKGLSYLLEACRLLKGSVELTLLGARLSGKCEPLDKALREHRWIPTLPHVEVLREMSRNDVLVFPSLFEGFGLVILEAMAQGLPVITTEHTAGPDIITDGEDGFLVPIRDAQAIVRSLELLRGDSGRLEAMKAAARRKAERFTWASYREQLSTLVGKVIQTGRDKHPLGTLKARHPAEVTP